MKTILILLFCSPFILFGQTTNGQVQDRTDNKAIAYVNIGVVGENIGTVSDEVGKFTLSTAKARPTDTVQFSMIGYQSKALTVKEFQALCADNCVIQLEKQAYNLEEVVVIPKDYKIKTVGNTTSNKSMIVGYESSELGYELGVLMKIKRRPTYIDQVKINVAKCVNDTIFYRLNIYEMKGKKPGKNILKKPIYLNFAKEDIKGSIVVDLQDKNVYVEDDFLVTMELVNEEGVNGLFFCAGLFNNKTYFRETSQGTWEHIPVGIGFSAKIRQEK